MTSSHVCARLGRALALVAASLAAACAGASAPDLVIRHARVFTNDAARPWAEAVAIKGERVVAGGGDRVRLVRGRSIFLARNSVRKSR